MSQGYHPIEGSDLLGDSWVDINATSEALATQFSGPTAPSSPLAYMIWDDTASMQKKQRNGANDAWIVIGSLGSDHLGLLPKSGGTMSGPIDMGGSAITNVGAGSGTAVARAQEVALKAPLASPAFTTDATLDVDPPGSTSLTRRSWTEARYLKLSGGTLTGALVLSGDGSSALHPVTKQQLEAALSTTAGHRHDGTDGRKVRGSDLDSGATVVSRTLVSDGSGNTAWGQVPKAMVKLSYVDIAVSSSIGTAAQYALTGISECLFLPSFPVITEGLGGVRFWGLIKTTDSTLYALLSGYGTARFYYIST